MAHPSSFYYLASGAMLSNEIEIEPPRTRIAIACNRCRRRKIKCSGSVEGASCEGCVRAHNAECVFADRPPLPKSEMSLDRSAAQLQPPSLPRSASLPVQPIAQLPMSDRQFRSLSTTSRVSIDTAKIGSPSVHAQAMRSPTYSTSPTIASNRQSLTSGNHPYQRPGSAGYRKNSGDQVANNLQRYSQSLIQGQALQLSGRSQQQFRSSSTSGPTSMPVRYVAPSTQQQQAQLQSLYLQQQQHAFVPHQNQPGLNHSLSFRHPDYSQNSSPVTSEFNAPPEYAPSQLVHAEDATSESACYSPVYQSSMYSMSTPDLVSSGSISTVDSRSSMSMSFPMQTNHQGQPTMFFSRQPSLTMDHAHLGNNVPLIDPTQWTPGVDKMAKQWLQFSPQQGDSFYFNALDQ